MGKAIITANNGNGYYNIDMVYDNSAMALRYESLVIQRNDVISKRAEIFSELSILNTEYENENVILKSYIEAGTYTDKQIADQTKIVQDIKNEISEVNKDLNRLQTIRNSLDIEINQTSGDTTVLIPLTAWSADYNDSIPIGATVGTIEPSRIDSFDTSRIIKPSYRDLSGTGYLYNEAEDGILENTYSAFSSGWSYNYMMQRGADTWKPRYIIANLISKDDENNTGVVSLYEGEKPHGLVGGTYNVTFEYMGCNSKSFEPDDWVVVDVSNEKLFVVIGFEAMPVYCCIKKLDERVLEVHYRAYAGSSSSNGYYDFCEQVKITTGASTVHTFRCLETEYYSGSSPCGTLGIVSTSSSKLISPLVPEGYIPRLFPIDLENLKFKGVHFSDSTGSIVSSFDFDISEVIFAKYNSKVGFRVKKGGIINYYPPLTKSVTDPTINFEYGGFIATCEIIECDDWECLP